jgi:hypothetical protein
MLKSRKTVRVLVRYGSHLYEKLAFRAFTKNHGKRSKEYGTTLTVPRGKR